MPYDKLAVIDSREAFHDCTYFMEFCGDHAALCEDCANYRNDMADQAMSADGLTVANAELLELASLSF